MEFRIQESNVGKMGAYRSVILGALLFLGMSVLLPAEEGRGAVPVIPPGAELSQEQPKTIYGGKRPPLSSPSGSSDSQVHADSVKEPVLNSNVTEKKEEPPKDQIRYILTRQGVIQQGIVTEQEKTVYIQFPERKGGYTISKLDVLLIGSSKEELFDYRRIRTRLNDTIELMKLADWCIRNQLVPSGLQLLRDAQLVTQNTTALEVIQKKIQQMELIEKIWRESQARMDQVKGSPVSTPRQEENRLEWEKWSRAVPTALQESFIRKIQPILIRRCGSSGCHSEADSRSFTVYQSNNGAPNRLKSLKNLAGVLHGVDRNDPSASSILGHSKLVDKSGTRIFPFGDMNSLKDYEQFVKWVKTTEGKLQGLVPPPEQEASSCETVAQNPDETKARETHTNAPIEKIKQTKKQPPVPTSNVKASEPDFAIALAPKQKNSGKKTGTDQIQLDPNSPEAILQRGGYLPAQVPRDVYDPLPFNSRYHPKQ